MKYQYMKANGSELRTLFIKWGLYLHSMELLFVLIFILTVRTPNFEFAWSMEWVLALLKNNIIPFGCVAMILLCQLFNVYFIYYVNGSTEGEVVTSVEDYDSNMMVFLMSYILPLASNGNFDSVRQVAFSGIVLFIIGKMCVDSEWLAANPTLLVMGYKVYKVGFSGRKEIVISRKKINLGDTIVSIKLNEAVGCY